VDLQSRKEAESVRLDPDIRVVFDQRADDCHVSLSGRITIDSSPDLRTLLLRRLESPSCQLLTVDFCEVAYVDISGVAILVELLKAARRLKKTFQLSGLRGRPRYLLESTRLLHLFPEVNAPCHG